MPTVCEGLRVLDFSWGMAGSLATMILADYGADVVKVEPPGGDPGRGQPAFLLWNRGKRSVVLDLKTADGQQQALALARAVDVVVEAFRPGVADRLGMSYEAVAAINPQVVYCSISGFGQTGSYRNLKGYDGIIHAKAGRMMNFAGQPQRGGPVYVSVPVATYGAASVAVQGVLSALYVRARTGHGQRVQTSLLQGLLSYDAGAFLTYQLTQRDAERYAPRATDRSRTLGLVAVPCKDGRWIQFHNLPSHLFWATMRAIGLGDMMLEPRFLDVPRVHSDEDALELRNAIFDRMLQRTSTEWLELFNSVENVAGDLLRTTQESLDHPQLLHNGQVIELDDPRVGKTKQVGPIALLSQTPARIASPAPDLGQHSAIVLQEWATEVQSRVAARNDTVLPKHALEGITVIELTSYVAAPMGVALLADLGARVIKVEPLDGDPFRHTGLGVSTVKTHQGKESLALDLRLPEAQKILHDLVAKADILIHSFRPGVPERLGFGYETLRAMNPRLIYDYAGAYGETGPYAHRPGFHGIGGAVGGGALAQAGGGTPPPSDTPLSREEMLEISRRLARANEHNADPNSSMALATGVLLGLLARERFGMSQKILSTMIGANVYANSVDAIAYEGKPPRRMADADVLGLDALYRLYRAGAGWVFLACPQQKEWERLCAALDRPDLAADPRFRDAVARAANDHALAAALEGTFQERTADEWEELLTAKDVACVRADRAAFGEYVNTDPVMRETGIMVEIVHPTFGRHLRFGNTVHLSLTPGKLGPGCEAGQHTRQILQELGYTAEAIEDLRARKIVACSEAPVDSAVR